MSGWVESGGWEPWHFVVIAIAILGWLVVLFGALIATSVSQIRLQIESWQAESSPKSDRKEGVPDSPEELDKGS